MARDSVFESGTEIRSLAIVAGETRVRLRDVGARALRRRPPILLWYGQELERGMRAPAATDVQLPDLSLAAGGRDLQIALGAVDLPEQVRSARDPAAIVDREDSATLEQSADGDLIIRGHRLALVGLCDRERLSAHGHGRRELSDLPKAVAERVRRVADRDPQHCRAVLPVVEVRVERLHGRPPAHSGTDQRRGEHLTDVALLDQVTHVRDRRRRAGLQTSHGEDALLLREGGQVLRLLQAVAEWPFAVHGLAGVDRRGRQLEVIRHLHGDGDDVHGRTVDELSVIVERGGHTEELARGVGRFASRGRQRRDLEVVRERRQRRNVRLRRPSAVRIGADDADTNPPGSILAGVDPHQATTFARSRCRTSSTSASTASARPARISSSVNSPSSKRVWACGTGSSTSSTRAPSAARTLRSSACAQAAPKAPVLAPTTATGLFRSMFVSTGREIQSTPFFKSPGSDPLYSGVAKSTASAFAIAAFKRATPVGRGWTSSSSSYGGTTLRPS